MRNQLGLQTLIGCQKLASADAIGTVLRYKRGEELVKLSKGGLLVQVTYALL